MLVILSFFALHWWASVFFQSFYLHRYAAHRQFSLSRRWERAFHFLTWVAQGSSWLRPRGYAILHRLHHAYSDTERDPHSPHVDTNLWALNLATVRTYLPLANGRLEHVEPRFVGGYPEYETFDRFANSWMVRAAWGAFYVLFYLTFATHAWMYLLLPIHFFMGPVHGMIVNWCGHKYGYRNFASKDRSRNTLAFDFVTLGELFQNNHHEYGMAPNFAGRWFEVDPTYQVMRVLEWLRVIDMGPRPQRVRWPSRSELPGAEPVGGE
jgi:stearoyl-CoA desaturase (delta-9 desaturase)